MKIVISKSYNGYQVPEEVCKKIKCNPFNNSVSVRTNPEFIKYLEEDETHTVFNHTKLCVIEIPDETSDFDVFDYNGMEQLIYVVNGKLRFS